uniref:(2Fe-2S) ferredoxin domain-containing protein n=1 Tax=Teichococcus oryzae TaxID=1608942 RepID=UPI001575C3BE|nr:(2Fe-2S) ferredoxin domain-containing protein [Pseudoroseomonas oryzae]
MMPVTQAAAPEATVPVVETQDPPAYFQAHVFVCCNRRAEGHRRGSCAAKGSEKLKDYMKSRAKELGIPAIRVNQAGCLDRCEFGPAIVIYPEGIWYRAETREDVDEILRAHLVEGGRARRLMLTEKDVVPKG